MVLSRGIKKRERERVGEKRKDERKEGIKEGKEGETDREKRKFRLGKMK